MIQHTTAIEVEYDNKPAATVWRTRDINVPCRGDVMTLPLKVPVAVKVMYRHWVRDKDQSDRPAELRCILICKKL